MKFHFNGGLDCPDWVLAQISEISKIEIPKFKHLCEAIVEHFKLKKFQWTESDLGHFSIQGLRQIKAHIAVLSFILEKSAKYECSPKDLGTEMLQLGLSAAHTEILVDLYKTESKLLRNATASCPFKAPSLQIIQMCRLQNPTQGEFQLIRTRDSQGISVNLAIREDQMDELKNAMESTITQLDRFT